MGYMFVGGTSYLITTAPTSSTYSDSLETLGVNAGL